MPFFRRSRATACRASKGWIVSLAACCSISNWSRASCRLPVAVMNAATDFSVACSSFVMAPVSAPAAIPAMAAFQAEPREAKL